MRDDVTVIDIVAQVTDQTADGAASATENVSKMEESMKKAQGTANGLKKMSKIQMTATLIDKASKGLTEITGKGKEIAGKLWSVTVGIVDKVTAPIRGMISKIGDLIGIAGVASGVLGTLTVKSALEASASQKSIETQLTTVLQNNNSAPEFKMGSKGDDVKYLQSRLNEMYNAGLNVDGRYGSLTDKAVKAYKAQTGLSTDDIMADKWQKDFDQILKHASDMQDETMYSGGAFEASAGEFATYLTDVNAIQQMMSTLADYAAGMSGGAELSESQMVDYATQLGKALNGEDSTFDGLKKKGFTVSDKQEKVLKSDKTSDLQKTAVLSEIIAESWEGLAKNFANTPLGKITQMKNKWDDILTVIGQKLEPSVGRFFKMLDTKLPAAGDLLTGGAEKLNDLIDWIMPSIESGIDSVISKIESIGKKLSEVTGSAEFQNANLFGKAKILWDEIIAKPFDEWWSGSGKTWLAEKATDIGHGLGSALKTGILKLLGMDTNEVFADGISIGQSFAVAFSEGFDTEKVMGAVWDAITDFISAHPLAATLYIGAKTLPALNKTLQMGSAVKGAFSTAGTTGAAGAGGAFGGIGAASVAGVVGAVLGTAGLISAASDLSNAATTLNEKERRDNYAKAGVKGGMVAAGATIGTLILPGLGTAIGAGIGGLGALTFGDKAGQGLSDLLNGTARIKETASNLREATTAYQEALEKDIGVQALIKQYEELDEAIKNGHLSTGDMSTAQTDMKRIVEELAKVYPDLISQYDIERGKLGEKLDLLKAISREEFLQRKAALEDEVFKAQTSLSDVGERFEKSQGEYAKHEGQYGQYDQAVTYLREQMLEGQKLVDSLDRITATGDEYWAVYNEIYEKLNSLFASTGEGLGEQGFDYDWFSFNGSGLAGMAATLDEFKRTRDKALDAMTKETQTQTELMDSVNAAYEAQKTLLEGELGDTLESIAKKYYDMGEEGQSAFLKAISELGEFTRQFSLQSSSWKADIEIWPKLMSDNPNNPYKNQSASGYSGYSPHAEGGIMNRPHMGLVAEDGAEAIIPLSGKRRERGLAIWERAGEILGVKPYADGGIVTPTPLPDGSGTGGGAVTIPVTIDNVTFEVKIEGGNGTDTESIIKVLKDNIKNLTDEIAHSLALSLQQVFANMPKAAEGAH